MDFKKVCVYKVFIKGRIKDIGDVDGDGPIKIILAKNKRRVWREIRIIFVVDFCICNVDKNVVDGNYLALVLKFENFDIIVKPHTRYGHQGSGFPPNVTFTPTMDTSALIDWADVVLFWASSAALEGFQKRKTMVCLDFLNGNRSFFALHQAGIICTSRDDLIPLLTNQEWNAGILKKAEAGTKKLIDDVIYNGHEESLIDRYLAFIEGSQPLTNRQKPGNKPAATEKTT
jgi:hypothetical protein